mgnify:CR=1 FL=1
MSIKHKIGFYEKYIKALQDACIALIALIVLSPVLLVVAVLVRVKLGSPVIFKQERAGKDGKPFYMYKFRSMSDARDAEGNLLPDEQRLGKFGEKLRSTSLDELPELLNILKGDMSVVGPRPECPELAEEYSNRIVRVVDGLVISDSAPLSEEEYLAEQEQQADKKMGKKNPCQHS